MARYLDEPPIEGGRMTALLWSASAVVAILVAADYLRDRARQRREDRTWAEIVQKEGP